jgi:hypothetical protein
MVNSLALPPGKADAIYFDNDVPGLGLRPAAESDLGFSSTRSAPSNAG